MPTQWTPYVTASPTRDRWSGSLGATIVVARWTFRRRPAGVVHRSAGRIVASWPDEYGLIRRRRAKRGRDLAAAANAAERVPRRPAQNRPNFRSPFRRARRTVTIVVSWAAPHRKPGELAEGRVDTAAALARAVVAVNALPQPVDAVIVSGDLVDSGKPAQYQHLRSLLAPLASPVYLLPGNHDDRGALRAAFPDHGYLRDARRAYLHYAVALGDLRLVVLDTSVAGATHGEIDAAQLADLDATLAAVPDMTTIVAMHHPPFRTLIERMDDYGLQRGGPGLAEVLARHPQVDRIVCGHLHRSIVARFAGRPVMTSPSTAHALA
jgi:3',5'-cyclic AMP phosphodiesterase CpdA